jgi:ribose transport system ATP-binding protein
MTVAGEKLSQSFAGIRVLDGVDITLRKGEVHALIGANGSGKSTLVKILTGVYQPEEGTIRVGGRALRSIASPHEATMLGIAVVHQEAPLIDTMTVAECIAMFRGFPISGIGRVRWRVLNEESAELLDRFKLPISPRQLAGALNPAERAVVALVIALDRVKTGIELLILDEVTASLPEDQAQLFLDRVSVIAADGTGVLMVTHRLAELHGLAKTVTVLRDGRVAYSASVGELSDEGLVAHMVGTKKIGAARVSAGASGTVRRLWNLGVSAKEAHALAPKHTPASGEAIVVEHLSGAFLRDVSFTVGAGEIVGVAGLIDSGIGELPQILGGITARRGGEIRIAGRSLAADSGPAGVIAAGVALLPSDRLRNGGIGTLSVADNVVLPQVDRFWHRPALEDVVLDQVIADFDIRPPSARALFSKLSGGNQQKTLLGKWLLTKPTVLVLDDPTSGVDPGAREKIFDILRDAAKEGVGVLFFSTEPEQLAAMCSRVLVLKGGAVANELSGADLTREMISRWCYA